MDPNAIFEGVNLNYFFSLSSFFDYFDFLHYLFFV